MQSGNRSLFGFDDMNIVLELNDARGRESGEKREGAMKHGSINFIGGFEN